MDDFGSIIYIIFTIIAIVYSIMRKANANQKNNTPTPYDDNEHQMPSFEDLFNPQPEVIKPKEPEKVVKEVAQVDEKVMVFQAKMKELDERMSRIKKEKPKTTVQAEKNESKSWFNAKEAIIYSEIMKRPEF